MLEAETIIVGGGPAGAAAALKLKQANREVIILDKANFPRLKLCAGWVTPKIFNMLGISPDDYPYGILKFDKLIYDFGKFRIPVKTTQFSIRRTEFDVWLHELSGVEVIRHKVEKIEKINGKYVIDGKFKSKYLIGAGGTYCPVFKTFFEEINPRMLENKIVALEEEFEYDWKDGNCYLWFGDLNLRGYSWYVPKANGYLNVGLGGTFYGLKRKGKNIREHWANFTNKLRNLHLVENYEFNEKGYSYYLRSNVKNVRRDNAFIVGDAAGLATIDMGEGIGPAIESGFLAAEAIISGAEYSLNKISKFSLPAIFFSKRFLRRF